MPEQTEDKSKDGLRCPRCGKPATFTHHEEPVSQEEWFTCDACGARTCAYEVVQANPGVIVAGWP